MKNRCIEIIALMLGLLTTAAGVLTLPQVAILPTEWQPYIGLALAFVVAGKNLAYVLLDWFDDGKLNKSYKLPGQVSLLILAGMMLSIVPSCASNGLGEKTYIGLTANDWGLVGKAAGQSALRAAVTSAVEEFGVRRSVTSAKAPVNVIP